MYSYISTFDCIDNGTCYLELLWTFASYHPTMNMQILGIRVHSE